MAPANAARQNPTSEVDPESNLPETQLRETQRERAQQQQHWQRYTHSTLWWVEAYCNYDRYIQQNCAMQAGQ